MIIINDRGIQRQNKEAKFEEVVKMQIEEKVFLGQIRKLKKMLLVNDVGSYFTTFKIWKTLLCRP